MKKIVYVAAWGTSKPKMVCLLDIVNDDNYVVFSKYRGVPILSYRPPDFKKYSKVYQKVTRAEFEAKHGKINYP